MTGGWARTLRTDSDWYVFSRCWPSRKLVTLPMIALARSVTPSPAWACTVNGELFWVTIWVPRPPVKTSTARPSPVTFTWSPGLSDSSGLGACQSASPAVLTSTLPRLTWISVSTARGS